MLSVNKITMIGHVAADPEVRETKTGHLVANFPLATNRPDYNGSDASTTDYHKIVAWGRLAQLCQDHLTKGAPLYIEGRLANRTYELPDKSKRFLTEIVLEQINLLTFKKKDGVQHVNLEKVEQNADV